MVVAVAVWLGLALAVPIALHFYSGNTVPDAVEASTTDSLALFRPVLLVANPMIRVERGTAMALDAGGKPISVLALMQQPSRTNLNLVLDNAVLRIGPARGAAAKSAERPSAAVDSAPESALAASYGPFDAALGGARFESLSVRRSVVLLDPMGDGGEALTDVRADIVLRRRGTLSLKGTGRLRGQLVTFALSASQPNLERSKDPDAEAAPARLPLRLDLKAAFAEAHFEGHLIAGAELGLTGQGELSARSGRQLVRWFGAYWPSGPGLRDIGVKGQFKLARRTLTFERASIVTDGNEGSGVVSLHLLKPRPQLTGTLAYKSFDVKPYFDEVAGQPKRAFNWAALTTGSLTVPFGMHLDADLRISTDRLKLGMFELGRSAASITLEDGRLLADLAELGFDKGEGRGQIAADFTGFVPRMTIRGKLDRVDLRSISTAVAGVPLLEAQGTVVADLAASGGTIRELMDRLAGKVTITSAVPGRLGIDLMRLADAVAAGRTDSWATLARGSTQFDKLDLKLVLREGILLTENAEISGRDSSWVATGVVNLPANRVDLRLVQTPAPAPNAAAKSAVLEFRGPWNEPLVRDAAALPVSDPDRR
jgi:AsmA protein